MNKTLKQRSTFSLDKKIWLYHLITFIFCLISIPTKFLLAADSGTAGQLKLQVPIFGYLYAEDIAHYTAQIYQSALYLLIPLAIVVIIYSGARWILSGGNAGQIQEAKKYIISAFLGLTIALGSYLILSMYGLTSLNQPTVENISAGPTDVINTETPAKDLCIDPSQPGCGPSSSSSFNDLLLHQAIAADSAKELENCDKMKVKGIPTEWKCPNCANVVELKQGCPPSIKNYPYSGCGTIGSSGCGIVSLTMVLNYYNVNLTTKQVADLAKKFCYRNCPGINPNKCVTPPDNCRNDNCSGTYYDTFTNPDQSAVDSSGKIKNYGPSKILSYHNLAGDILTKKLLETYELDLSIPNMSTPATDEIDLDKVCQAKAKATGCVKGKETVLTNKDTEKAILTYLSQGLPIIISTSNEKVTSTGHFIVLIGCTDCFDAKKVKIFYRDPNRYSGTPFTANNKLFKTLHSAFFIHHIGSKPGTTPWTAPPDLDIPAE